MSDFASRLRALRTKHKLRQKDVANKLGITESAYGYYEQGRREPSHETLQQLATMFDVTVDYLVVGRSGNTEYKQQLGRGTRLERDELLQELTDDPDDLYFLDGYLDASDEEKKELRRHWLEIKRQMRENNIKPTAPMSLRDFNEKIKKPD
ncbi:helix-turn-helix domain-containing protein [Brevibacillus agri]|uniref:helix-turn-helix domain-containing protein n=1 Tax=Brevibacillus agri TaxID=51101 RepID=UPI002E1BBA94|nr:helix-turn-helix domain-containing protein [Brevibacillus agri]